MIQTLSTMNGMVCRNDLLTGQSLPLKKYLIICLVLMGLTISQCPGEQTSPAAPCTLAIVMDTSPTSHDTELRWAALTFYRNSAAGDRILFFVVRDQKTRLMFSYIKTLEQTEFSNIAAIINDIKPEWFAHADLSTALSGPIYEQLRQQCGPDGHAIITLISTGNFSDRQAADLAKFGNRIKNNKWALAITGLVDKTPRRVFLSANRGEFYWYSLTDASSGSMVYNWLKEIRHKLVDNPSLPAATIPQQIKQPQKVEHNEPNTIRVIPHKMDNTAPTPQPVKHTLPEEPAAKSDQPHKDTIPSVPAAIDLTAQKDQTNPICKTIPQNRKPPVVPPAAEPNTAQKTSPNIKTPTLPLNTVTPKTTTTPKHIQRKSSTIPAGNRGPWENILVWKAILVPVLTIAAGCLMGIIFLFAYRSWTKAKSWKKTASRHLDAFTNKPRHRLEILMAQVGQATYRLGNVRHFRKVFIGRSAKNVIRIERDGIQDRHVKIYRWYSALWVKNLSPKPVRVHGRQLAAGKKMKLLLPAEIKIADGIEMRVFIHSTEIIKTSSLQETDNGTKQ